MTKVLLFTHFREQLGKEELAWEATPILVRDFKNRLKSDYGLEGVDDVMIAVNEEYAENDTVIEDGDTVALLQPVSGG